MDKSFARDGEITDTLGRQIERLSEQHFVGRSFELHLFMNYLSRLKEKTENILNIYGTGGMGKTYLLEQFRRHAARAGFDFIHVDIPDYASASESICGDIVAQLGATGLTPAQSALDRCIDLLNAKAQSRQLVLAFDQYEKIGSADQWIREKFIARLHTRVLVIISGRFPLEGPWRSVPAWRKLIVRLPLTELTYSDIRCYAELNGIADENAVDAIWLQTLGHPLAVSLLVADAMKPGRAAAANYRETIGEVMDNWLQEARDDELRGLIMAASVPKSFNQEVLSAMTGQDVAFSLFERLIRLSFVRTAGDGWQLHEMIRETVLQSFRKRMPQLFQTYCVRLTGWLRERILARLEQQAEVSWELSELLQIAGNSLMRAHFRHARQSQNYWETLHPSNMAEAESYVAQRLLEPREWKVKCSDPELSAMHRYTFTAEQSVYRLVHLNLRELAAVDASAVKLLRCPEGRVAGLAAIMPINGKTVDYLMNAPVSRAYFRSLPASRIQQFRATEPQNNRCWFILSIDGENLENEELRSDIIQLQFEYILGGNLIVSSPPPLDYYDHAHQSLGFEMVPGAEHHDYGSFRLAKTYVMDTRKEKLHHFISKIASEPQTARQPDVRAEAPLAESRPRLTPREREVADLLLLGYTNAEIAGQLFISIAAVKKHINSLLQKYDLKNRTQLVSVMMGKK